MPNYDNEQMVLYLIKCVLSIWEETLEILTVSSLEIILTMLLKKMPDLPFNFPFHQPRSCIFLEMTVMISSFLKESSSSLRAVYGYRARAISGNAG